MYNIYSLYLIFKTLKIRKDLPLSLGYALVIIFRCTIVAL